MATFNAVKGPIWSPYALWLTIELLLWSIVGLLELPEPAICWGLLSIVPTLALVRVLRRLGDPRRAELMLLVLMGFLGGAIGAAWIATVVAQ
ncbi:hypothetical protein A9C11_01910 [Pseudomonas citronellolis]|uniref:Uncharacterized protein n=1 Tax=Pseudomonas citronellolis TaxID=53408 RepID=A0A1A9K764_9PSED|nr:hypothetical protein A9C11_01910 [Pseudomonas citronellolis]